MKKILVIFSIFHMMISCNGQKKTDLSKLNLSEPIENIIDFDNHLLIGVETVEYPFSLLLETENPGKYNFEGIDLKGQKVIFQIHSETLKTDSITRFGGGHLDLQALKNPNDLKINLKKFKAENKIYGYRIEMKTKSLKLEILQKLKSKYGKGKKNPNTDNGLYWNIKAENKLIFYAPDYNRLIVLNNSDLSKTCYWDTFNGLIDFGGCDNLKYTQELTKNATKPEDTKNKPVIKIDKNWNINGLIPGKTSEEDFINLKENKIFERIVEIDGSSRKIRDLYYKNDNFDISFLFSIDKSDPENAKKNMVRGYSLQNLKKTEITFENGLKPGMKWDEVIQLFDKGIILNYADLKFSNYIEIKNTPYKVTLNFDENKLFSGMYIQ